jgi:hypothetical protein
MALVTHPGACQREISLEVFARIAESVTPQLKAQLPVLAEVFRVRLGDQMAVRLAALRALCGFLESLEESETDVFQPLLPVILAAVSDPEALAAEKHTKDMLELLV